MLFRKGEGVVFETVLVGAAQKEGGWGGGLAELRFLGGAELKGSPNFFREGLTPWRTL